MCLTSGTRKRHLGAYASARFKHSARRSYRMSIDCKDTKGTKVFGVPVLEFRSGALLLPFGQNKRAQMHKPCDGASVCTFSGHGLASFLKWLAKPTPFFNGRRSRPLPYGSAVMWLSFLAWLGYGVALLAIRAKLKKMAVSHFASCKMDAAHPFSSDHPALQKDALTF